MPKKFLIRGGNKLEGEVKISGSKNAALPIIAASLLADSKVILKNVPDINDVHKMCALLEVLNVKTKFEKNTLAIDPTKAKLREIPLKMTGEIRASILLLGAMLGRFKKAKIGYPGGCVIGRRSVSTHLIALEQMGVKLQNVIDILSLDGRNIKGRKIVMREPSVTATENVIMAAALAPGETEIRLAASEPHVQDLCKFLNKMGAKIKGMGTNNLQIEGVKKLKGVTYSIIGDYIEAGTMAIAAVITKGDVTIKGFDIDQMDAFFNRLRETGANFELTKDGVRFFKQPKSFKAIKKLDTRTYPGFPTDLQAPFGVLLTQCDGISKIFETLFEDRLSYLFELEKMGARIEVYNPHQALVVGPANLKGATVTSYDLRAGAAMVLAGLIASGETEVVNINYIDRGYERLDEKLRKLGADIRRAE